MPEPVQRTYDLGGLTQQIGLSREAVQEAVTATIPNFATRAGHKIRLSEIPAVVDYLKEKKLLAPDWTRKF